MLSGFPLTPSHRLRFLVNVLDVLPVVLVCQMGLRMAFACLLPMSKV